MIVDVTDVNEPPVFISSHYITSISEGATIGQVLFTGILAVDNDEVYLGTTKFKKKMLKTIIFPNRVQIQ